MAAVATASPEAEVRAPSSGAVATSSDHDNSATEQLSRLLADRAKALAVGDEAGWLAPLDPREGTLRAEQQAVFDRLRALPLQTWTYARDRDRWVIRYQLRGDQQTSEVAVTPQAEFVDGQWRLTALGQASPALWDLEDLSVVEGQHSLVLGAADARSLQAWADAADRAVATVDSVWGTEWARRLVLVLPQEWTQVAGLLGGRAYPGYAGLTTSLDPAGRGPGQRILLNPGETARLSPESRALLVAHEATHVATEGLPGVPLWVAEGLAEYVANADSTNSVSHALPVLLRAARSATSRPSCRPTRSLLLEERRPNPHTRARIWPYASSPSSTETRPSSPRSAPSPSGPRRSSRSSPSSSAWISLS